MFASQNMRVMHNIVGLASLYSSQTLITRDVHLNGNLKQTCHAPIIAPHLSQIL